MVTIAMMKKARMDLTARDCAKDLYDRGKKRGEFPAGVGSAHRDSVLSCFPFFPLDDPQKKSGGLLTENNLLDVCDLESEVTHYSPQSKAACRVVNVICRLLITSTFDSLDGCLRYLCENPHLISPDFTTRFKVESMLQRHIEKEKRSLSSLDRGGYSINTLDTALYFVRSTSSFESAMKKSVAFAGCGNYCPVLVGPIAGALYGIEQVEKCSLISHSHNSQSICTTKREGLKECVALCDQMIESPTGKYHQKPNRYTPLDLADYLSNRISDLWEKDEEPKEREN